MVFSDLVQSPIFDILGCDAVLSDGNGFEVSIRAVDRTRGVPVTQNGVETGTLAPAAVVKAADLAAEELVLADLTGLILTLNGKSWEVTAAAPRPGPEGESTGQIFMFLIEYSA